MKRPPFVALLLLAAIVCGLALLPSSSGAQGRKGEAARRAAAAPDEAAAPSAAADSGEMSPALLSQIESLVREKESRTPAQQKLDSQLVYAIKQARGEPVTEAVRTLETGVKVDERGLTVVDIRGRVTKRVLAAIANEGGRVVNYFKSEQSIRAELPLLSVERIALLPEVKFIRPAEELVLHKADAAVRRPAGGDALAAPPGKSVPAAAPAVNPTLPRGLRPGFAARAAVVGERLRSALAATAARAARQEDQPVLGVGAATAESDTTHRTREARNFFGLTGKGLKIGVISDSFNFKGGAPANVAAGDLPGPGNPFGHTAPVAVVQESGSTDEGRAMAQIIHDIAPAARLFFATANGGQANFANNIRALRNTHGCDIIVDDVAYLFESPLHKSATVSRAVDDVTAAGAMYFSAAGNFGNLNDGTSGVWEGNFTDAGADTGGITTAVAGGTFHDFDGSAGGVATQNPIVRAVSDSRLATLFWSDPLGGSANDYDLYLISGAGDTPGGEGRIISASTNVQAGTQDPLEAVSVPSAASGAPSGRRIAVFKKTSAAARFIHVNLNGNRFAPAANANIPAFTTAGEGGFHAATGDGYSVAATPADGPFPSTHSGADKVETFSSDGPRRIFYDYNNAPLTADLTASGGAVRQKPDITAADGVMTTVPGFQPFFGTSAAAPTAAAVAALIKASNAALTPAQILAAMSSTAIDIEAPGVDRDSGAGIVNPFPALQSLDAAPGATIDIGAAALTPTSGCDSAFDAGERATLTIALNNVGGGGASAVVATLTSQTPGVTVVQSTSAYPNIPASGSATNLRQFTIQTAAGAAACGARLKFSLTVTFAGGQASPATFPVTVQTGTSGSSPASVAYAGSAVNIPDGNTAGVNIPLNVSGFTGSVSDLNFRVGGGACSASDNATANGVNHNWVGDLVFKLTSPAGTTVTVISQAGGVNNSGNNFCNTVLDDDTANGSIQAVTAAQSPYAGTFKPANPLSAFDGENPNGVWTLNVSDVFTPDAGNVTAFSLDITQFSCAAVPATTISGRVTGGGGGGAGGVNLSLTGTEQQTVTTDSNGDYSFTLSTCGGAYTVTPTKAGHTFSPPRQTFVNVAGSHTANFTAANAVTPSGATPGQIVISEFRARGASGDLDEFVEIANRADAPVTVGASDGSSDGWLLAALNTNGTSSTPVYTIPNGTVIPARGRYLVANAAGYTLDDYAKADAYTTADIPDNTGLALFDAGTTSGAVLDAAGFNAAAAGFADTYREGGGMPPVGTTDGQYSFVRSLATGSPRDTNVNADDFDLVAPDAGSYGGRQSRLGAPGPENSASPVNRNDRIKASLIDIAQSNSAPPNVVRDFASYADALTPTTAGDFADGTFSIRRRFTNQTANLVSRLRFRIVDATVGPAPAGTADLRLLSSPDLVVGVSPTNCASPPCTVTLAGLTLEQPAAQAAGGGLNSTVAAGTISPAEPLAPGASLSVEFRLGVRQTGAYRFFITVEALP